MENFATEILEVSNNYNKIFEELNVVKDQVTKLLNKQKALSDELHSIRNIENILINKIEAKLNREITQEDIVKILKNGNKG